MMDLYCYVLFLFFLSCNVFWIDGYSIVGSGEKNSTVSDDERGVYKSSQHLNDKAGKITHTTGFNNGKNTVDRVWLIKTDPSWKIKLQFVTFYVKSDSNCRNNYIEIYDADRKYQSSFAGRYCNDVPKDILSSYSNMMVIYHGTEEDPDTNFELRWSSYDNTPEFDVCGDSLIVFDGSPVYITSPNYENRQYAAKKNCVLQFTAAPDTVFKIEMKDFQLEKIDFRTRRCNDFLSLREGVDEEGKELARLCGILHNRNTIYTKGNKLYLKFNSDEQIQDRGFKLELSTIEKPTTQVSFEPGNYCQQRFIGESGRLSNPSSLVTSSEADLCTWIIEGKPQSSINLNFDVIDLPGNCDTAYVLIRDGETSGAPLLGKYCGWMSTPISVRPRGNKIWVEYKNLDKKNGKFVLNWSQRNGEAQICGGEQTGTSGHLNYRNSKTSQFSEFCLWNIRAKPGQRIALKIQESEIGEDCIRSYIEVKDGMGSLGDSHGKFCNEEQRVRNIVSTENMMTVELRTTCLGAKRFRATWRVATSVDIRNYRKPKVRRELTTLDPLTTIGPIVTSSSKVLTTSATVVEGVDGALLITGTAGIIQSPSFPAAYPADRVKIWILRGPRDGTIRLQFNHFDLEHDYACRYDYVEVRNGGSTSAPLVDKFCGTRLPAVILSSASSLFIKFKSDSSSSGKGFMAKWNWIENAISSEEPEATTDTFNICGGIHTAESGVISSPQYPDIYPVNMDCLYIIKPQFGRRVRIEFLSFDLEADYQCSFDYLQIKEGYTSTGRQLKRLCGGNLPRAITTNRGALWIRFKSDDTTSRTGFSLSYKVLA